MFLRYDLFFTFATRQSHKLSETTVEALLRLGNCMYGLAPISQLTTYPAAHQHQCNQWQHQ